MTQKKLLFVSAAALAASLSIANANATMQITEWEYNGLGVGGEFVELTNMGSAPIDLTGWSYDDDSRTPGVLNLSGFGTVAVGESVIIAEDTAAAFRSAWSLASSVKVVGSNTANLGRSDEINIFDATNALVDRLTYSDVTYPGTIRTQNRSGNPTSVAALGPQTISTDWVLASAGDAFGSYASASGDIGNPGTFIFAPVPEPSTYALLAAGLALVGVAARCRA